MPDFTNFTTSLAGGENFEFASGGAPESRAIAGGGAMGGPLGGADSAMPINGVSATLTARHNAGQKFIKNWRFIKSSLFCLIQYSIAIPMGKRLTTYAIPVL
jgi:hypothetical protein